MKVCLILLNTSLFAVATFELDYSRWNWYSGLCFVTELHCCTENPMVALCKTDKCSLLFSEQCTVVIRNLYTRITVLWWRVCVSLKLCCLGAFAPVSISNGKKCLVSHPRPGSDSEAGRWGWDKHTGKDLQELLSWKPHESDFMRSQIWFISMPKFTPLSYFSLISFFSTSERRFELMLESTILVSSLRRVSH